MSQHKKTKAPIRLERWKPWAQRVISEMKTDLLLYEEYIERFEENLTNVNTIQPQVDFTHHAGMMSRIDNSLRKFVGAHHARLMCSKYREQGDPVEGELVVLMPDWQTIAYKDYSSYDSRGYIVDTSFSQKFWGAFQECLNMNSSSKNYKSPTMAIGEAIANFRYFEKHTPYMKNEVKVYFEIFKKHEISKSEIEECCRHVYLDVASNITFHVLARANGYVMLLGTDAKTYVFEDKLFMLVDDKRVTDEVLG